MFHGQVLHGPELWCIQSITRDSVPADTGSAEVLHAMIQPDRISISAFVSRSHRLAVVIQNIGHSHSWSTAGQTLRTGSLRLTLLKPSASRFCRKMASPSRISYRGALSSRCSVQPSVPAAPGFVHRGQPHTTRNVLAGNAPAYTTFATLVCHAVIAPALMAALTEPDRCDLGTTSRSVLLHSCWLLFDTEGCHVSQYRVFVSVSSGHMCNLSPWCRGICSCQRRRGPEQRSTTNRTGPATIRSNILLRNDTCRVVQRGNILQQPMASRSPRCS